ncbi:hypothetical protein [Polymorphobacter multimanifer]|uniref:HK97 gp10 family phage protein n=1 Tax=Polymorphobacter multimanifer TaxID=1070431 RepID=A0A841L827_9SPHN|nr:hypothetical protein [Polymorphobacter multimanifer]MBB6228356.1 hypothetical protein [Polymorphobacter multimanifer]
MRKILKLLPDEARASLIGIYREEAPGIVAFMRGRVPKRTGFGASSINSRIREKTLSLQVGLLGAALNGRGKRGKRLGGKKARSAFYLTFLERGRGGGRTRTFTRATPSGGRSKPFTARKSPISRGRYDFIEGVAAKAVIARIRPKLAAVWDRALANLRGVS